MADELNCVRKEYADRRIPEVHEFSTLIHEYELWEKHLFFCAHHGFEKAKTHCTHRLRSVERKIATFFDNDGGET